MLNLMGFLSLNSGSEIPSISEFSRQASSVADSTVFLTSLLIINHWHDSISCVI